MRRFGLVLAAVCLTVLICVVRLHSGSSESSDGDSDRVIRGRQAESRYLQAQPHHWRALLIQQ